MTAITNDADIARHAIQKVLAEMMPGHMPISVAGTVGSIRLLNPGLSLTDSELFDMIVDQGIHESHNLHFDRAKLAGMVKSR